MTTIRINSTEKVTVSPEVTENIVVTIRQTGPQGALGGAGDYLDTPTYDPTSVSGDAFDMDSMVESATKKVLTASERAVIALTSGTNTGDQDLSAKEDTGVAAGLMTSHTTTHPAPTNRDTRNASALGSDDNYVTDAEKIVIGNTTGTNTGDQVIPTALADLSEDPTHRIVTTAEKTAWDAKQDPLVADTDYLTPGTAASTYAPVLGADDNYVTDAEKIVIGNTSGTNTGDQDLSGKQDNITLTTTGTSGAATLVGATLNIPQYSGGGGGVTEGDVVALVIALG